MKGRVGLVLFWLVAILLLIPIVTGLLTEGVRTRRVGTVLVSERSLEVQTARGVRARVRVAGLGENPALKVEAHGLGKDAPLRLVLVDTTGTAKPFVLEGALPVKASGTVEADIPVPDKAFRLYGEVVARQGRRIVFRADLG